jgi:hypothetical protein
METAGRIEVESDTIRDISSVLGSLPFSLSVPVEHSRTLSILMATGNLDDLFDPIGGSGDGASSSFSFDFDFAFATLVFFDVLLHTQHLNIVTSRVSFTKAYYVGAFLGF